MEGRPKLAPLTLPDPSVDSDNTGEADVAISTHHEQLTTNTQSDQLTTNTQPDQIHQTTQRPKSPSVLGNVNMEFIMKTQASRLEILNEFYDAVKSTPTQDVSVENLKARLNVSKSVWDSFELDHERLGMVAKRTILSHPYVTENVYHSMSSTYHNLVTIIQTKLASLNTQPPTQPANQPSLPTHRSKLPELSIPSFSGSYDKWTSFRDLFSSMVIKNDLITDVERMHYLRSSLKGEAAQLVSTLPCDGDSFRSAWNLVTKRYNNKRVLISSTLDRLISDHSIIKCTAHDLTTFITGHNEALNQLAVLGVDASQWETVLVHIITKRLDHRLLESWENRLGSSTEFPSLKTLTDFLWDKARAQERLEASTQPAALSSTQSRTQPPTQPRTQLATQQSSSKTTSSARSRPSPTHNVTTNQQPTSRFQCDMCGQHHFIVSCPQFAQLSPQRRMDQIVKAQLCYNCLGRHNVRSCQSTKLCKTCNRKHHTMLHGSSQPTQQ